jgi:hypothetical protein
LVAYYSRDADASGLLQCFQPRRDIDPVAENVVMFRDHVPEIDSDAEPDAAALGHVRLAVDHPALDLHSASHGNDHARASGPSIR